MAASRQEFPIEQKLRKDIQDAQRARDQLRLDTLRMALGAIHNLEVARTDRKNPEYGQPLTEADCLRTLEQEVKKREQAIPLYEQGGRADLVDKEQQELNILQSYLQGSQLSDDELRALLAPAEADLVIVGHTHVPLDRTIEQVRVFNLGSVSNPMRSRLEASYAILEANSASYNLQLRYVDYDRQAVIEELQRVKHPTVDFLAKFMRGEILPPWTQR